MPSRPDRRLDAAETLQILRETRNCCGHARRSPATSSPSHAPTAWFEAASPLRVRLDSGSSIGGDIMSARIDRYNRLEPRPNDRDMQTGFAARIHDPLWLLARQWQMGEHQGENASSPVRIDA